MASRYAPPIETDPAQHLLITAASVVDAAGFHASPGALLLGPRTPSGRTLLVRGTPPEVQVFAASRSLRPIEIDRPHCVLTPGFVNAHTHLDLSPIGPQTRDPDAGFMAFIDLVRAQRPSHSADITRAVELGIKLSLSGGVVAVGDIAGAAAGQPRLEPFHTLARSPLSGVSFLEFFAIGKGESPGLARLDACLANLSTPSEVSVRFGLSPHATNTVSPAAYKHALHLAFAHGWPLITHAAETPEEHAFIAHAAGPQRTFLERLGLWDDALLDLLGHNRSPIEHLAPLLTDGRLALVHVNDASDRDLSILASTQTPVVYCPRASAYFGADSTFGPHRYMDMLAAGIPVALGTDSIINLDRNDRITPFDDACLLVQRDGLVPNLALQMLTIAGAQVLGIAPTAVSFTAGHHLFGCVAITTPNPSHWPSIFQTESELELLQ